MPDGEIDGENVGIARFGADGAAHLWRKADEIVRSGSLRDWAPRAFGAFATEQALFAVGTRALPWTEIDTPDDYRYASTTVFPAIKSAVDELEPAWSWGA
jgi:choline kinase